MHPLHGRKLAAALQHATTAEAPIVLRRETSVGIANPVIVFGFRKLPAVYDRLVVPLMRVGGLSKAPVEVNDGNVFDPVPAGKATHGEWGRHWLRGVAVAVASPVATGADVGGVASHAADGAGGGSVDRGAAADDQERLVLDGVAHASSSTRVTAGNA